MRARDRTGMTLLEVLVALTVLAVGAAAWAGLAVQSTRATEHAAAQAREVVSAARELDRATILSRDALLARNGTQALSLRWQTREVLPGLIAVAMLDTSGRVVLATTFYRRGTYER